MIFGPRSFVVIFTWFGPGLFFCVDVYLRVPRWFFLGMVIGRWGGTISGGGPYICAWRNGFM